MFVKDDLHANNITVIPNGFAVIPANCTLQDFPDLLAYLEDGEPCLSAVMWEKHLQCNGIKFDRGNSVSLNKAGNYDQNGLLICSCS